MKVKFVAEVSSNHNQDLNRCLEFISKAAAIGSQAVKFQLFKIDQLFAPEIVKKNQKIRQLKAWELPFKFIPKLAKKCHHLGLEFACTPFYLKAIEELKPYVDFYKIASYDILRNDLLKACAKTGKSIVLSTGMANLKEIDTAIKILKQAKANKITLLQCLSSYPAPAKEYNLKVIDSLRKRYGCKTGLSDHSVNPNVLYRSVYKWKASLIEFHLDLEGQGQEFKIGHCWLPEQIAVVINKIKKGIRPRKESTLADGDGIKKVSKVEITERDWRADPSDGLRPMLKIRKQWVKK